MVCLKHTDDTYLAKPFLLPNEVILSNWVGNMKTAIVAILALLVLFLPASAQLVGSRDNPVPMGTSVDMSNNWEITVLSVIPNATNEMVYGENHRGSGFVRDPDEEFFIVKIQAKYIGPGSSRFNNYLSAVGSASLGYTPISINQGEGAIPDYISRQEVFSGGVLTGILVWIIPPAHADHLVMYDPIIDINKRTYMALF
jgi:hypothetical protein